MQRSLPRQILSMHAVPYIFFYITCFFSIALATTFWLGWAIWLVAILVIVAWMPLVCYAMNSIWRKYGMLAFVYILVVSQTLHLAEHTAQMVQLHILGLSGANANGIISTLNTEWVHFIWNSWVLLFSGFLLYPFRQNKWMWMLFIFAIWHEIEHIYIMHVYLTTGISGTPGLIARGGAIGGGLPLIRPDVHFLYAVLEEALLLRVYYCEIKKQHRAQAMSTLA